MIQDDSYFNQQYLLMKIQLFIALLLALAISTVPKQDTDHDTSQIIDRQSCSLKCQSAQDADACLETCLQAFREQDQTDSAKRGSQIEKSVETLPQTVIDQQPNHEKVEQQIEITEEKEDTEGQKKNSPNQSNIDKILINNQQWAQSKLKQDENFFKKHVNSQSPQYLWIGCSDSRINANQILGLEYGQVFIMRNVANIVSPSDISAITVIQYAVDVLKVKDIIVGGHYGCGGVKAAVTKFNHGALEAWLSKLRRIRYKYSNLFESLTTTQQKTNLLVEINVKEQVMNVVTMTSVQQAWKNGQQLRVHGMVYNMTNGRLVNLNVTKQSLKQIPQQLIVVEH